METIDKLTDVMNLGHFHFVDIHKTSDGHYLGMEQGDIGFNAFLGRPKPVHNGAGLDRTLRIWSEFTETEKTQVLALARSKGINLVQEFGIPAFEEV